MPADEVLFRESQRFRQPYIIVLVLLPCVLTIAIIGYGMISQLVFDKPFGNDPMPDLVLLISGPVIILLILGPLALVFLCRLETTVRPDGLYVRFYPFHLSERKIPLEILVSFRALTYRPIRDYGGWGLRFGKGGRAYNVHGRKGVRLEFADGKHLLIGSQRSEELAAAIEVLFKT